jgi:uncharacterized damage-inducible protein DinB
MRRTGLLLVLILAPLMPAQEESAKSDPAISPVRQEILAGFDGAANRALALAKAIPEDQYSWRPMEGVRSFKEVFVHMAGSLLLFGSYAGVQAPAGPAHDLAAAYMKRGFEMPEIFAVEAAVGDKAQVIAIMEQCFQLARDLIRKTPDSDLDRTVQFFGKPATIRSLLMVMGSHLSEHLGQSIAYARVNHIVPPWSRKAG